MALVVEALQNACRHRSPRSALRGTPVITKTSGRQQRRATQLTSQSGLLSSHAHDYLSIGWSSRPKAPEWGMAREGPQQQSAHAHIEPPGLIQAQQAQEEHGGGVWRIVTSSTLGKGPNG
jgi:hypothetical protein